MKSIPPPHNKRAFSTPGGFAGLLGRGGPLHAWAILGLEIHLCNVHPGVSILPLEHSVRSTLPSTRQPSQCSKSAVLPLLGHFHISSLSRRISPPPCDVSVFSHLSMCIFRCEFLMLHNVLAMGGGLLLSEIWVLIMWSHIILARTEHGRMMNLKKFFCMTCYYFWPILSCACTNNFKSSLALRPFHHKTL